MGQRISLLIVAALASSACAAPEAPVSPGPAVVPAVTLETLTGGHTEVTRLAAGRVAVLSMWATWCDACVRETDALNRLDAKTAAGSDAVVIAVDVGEDPGKVAEFAHRRGLRYAQLVDQDFAFADALGQRRVPATLVIDRHGRIVFRGDSLDEQSLDALRDAVAASP